MLWRRQERTACCDGAAENLQETHPKRSMRRQAVLMILD